MTYCDCLQVDAKGIVNQKLAPFFASLLKYLKHLEKTYFSPDLEFAFIYPFKLGFALGIVFLFDLMWLACMTVVPPSTNKVYICPFPPTLTRWMDHVTVPIIICKAVQGFPRTMAMCGWQMYSLDGFWSCSGSSGSSFSWLLITARCAICFRRIMFPILTTVLSNPRDLYNCTECEPDV